MTNIIISWMRKSLHCAETFLRFYWEHYKCKYWHFSSGFWCRIAFNWRMWNLSGICSEPECYKCVFDILKVGNIRIILFFSSKHYAMLRSANLCPRLLLKRSAHERRCQVAVERISILEKVTTLLHFALNIKLFPASVVFKPDTVCSCKYWNRNIVAPSVGWSVM